MMPKWMPKSMIFDTFSKKAKSHETIQKQIEFQAFGMQKGIKNQSKNPCKIDARKRLVKSMENDAKMHPKWEPKSIQNLKNTGKRVSEN